jgi:hypothetical protein
MVVTKLATRTASKFDLKQIISSNPEVSIGLENNI